MRGQIRRWKRPVQISKSRNQATEKQISKVFGPYRYTDCCVWSSTDKKTRFPDPRTRRPSNQRTSGKIWRSVGLGQNDLMMNAARIIPRDQIRSGLEGFRRQNGRADVPPGSPWQVVARHTCDATIEIILYKFMKVYSSYRHVYCCSAYE